MGREVGVGVHGGGDALKLVGGGSRPGVPCGGSHGGSADGQAHRAREEKRRAGFIGRVWEREVMPSLLRVLRH
jgi:hypothetical protein